MSSDINWEAIVRIYTIASMCVLMTACSTDFRPNSGFAELNGYIRALVGKPIEVAFREIGLPDEETEIAGMHGYVWAKQNSFVMPLTQSSTTSSANGSAVASASATSYVPVNYSCRVRLFVDNNEMIAHGDFDGNWGGCELFVKRFRAIAEPKPRK